MGYGDSLAVSLGISDKYGWFARLIERSLCGTRVLSAHSAKRLYTSRSCSRQNVLLYTLTRCMFTSAVVCPLQATLHTCHWRYVSDGVIVTVRSLVLFYATLCTAVGYVTTWRSEPSTFNLKISLSPRLVWTQTLLVARKDTLASFPGSQSPEREHWSCAGVESLVLERT